MKIKTISIVGLGLMGGSLAAACRKRFPKAKIVGISRDALALRLALKKRWIHKAASDLKTGVQDADLVILCTPVDTLSSLLIKVDRFAKKKTVVTDVGSVKGPIVDWAKRRKFKNISFIGAHPLVGSHDRGMQAAKPDLYDRGFTFVIKGSGAAFREANAFWKKISPRVILVSAKTHDQIASEISHLPHLMAFCLSLTPSPQALSFAGTGFADTTRVAKGHPSVWVPIFQSNRKAVLQALRKFENQICQFKKSLNSRNENLARFLMAASKRRRQISL